MLINTFIGRNSSYYSLLESRNSQAAEPATTVFEFPGLVAYDVSSDGEHFVILADNPEAPARDIQVIQNFSEVLKQLVPN